MLTDLNSDFGMDGSLNASLEVSGIEALVNMLKNLFRSSTNTDRFEYIDSGVDLEKLLHEPPTEAGADAVFLIIINALSYNMPQITLNTSRSSVTPNQAMGEYDVELILNNQAVSFSL